MDSNKITANRACFTLYQNESPLFFEYGSTKNQGMHQTSGLQTDPKENLMIAKVYHNFFVIFLEKK